MWQETIWPGIFTKMATEWRDSLQKDFGKTLFFCQHTISMDHITSMALLLQACIAFIHFKIDHKHL